MTSAYWSAGHCISKVSRCTLWQVGPLRKRTIFQLRCFHGSRGWGSHGFVDEERANQCGSAEWQIRWTHLQSPVPPSNWYMQPGWTPRSFCWCMQDTCRAVFMLHISVLRGLRFTSLAVGGYLALFCLCFVYQLVRRNTSNCMALMKYCRTISCTYHSGVVHFVMWAAN